MPKSTLPTTLPTAFEAFKSLRGTHIAPGQKVKIVRANRRRGCEDLENYIALLKKVGAITAKSTQSFP